LICLKDFRALPSLICLKTSIADVAYLSKKMGNIVMKVANVMTYRVISVTPEVSAADAARLMLEAEISGLPVVDYSGNLVGIVTEGDFLRRAETGTTKRRARWLEFITSPGKLAEEYSRSHGRKVSEIMTADPQTVTEETSLEQAVDLMERHRIKRLPVTRQGKPVGMLSRANLMRGLVDRARSSKSSAAADWAIRDQILAELRRHSWSPIYSIDVKVRSGSVDMYGTILDERERKAIIVAAENTPGVKHVRDHIALIEPTSGMLIYQPDEEARRANKS
jgi:CBS domain-containing protein